VLAAMANCEPHGFVFDHVGRQPSSASSSQRRSTAAGDPRCGRSRTSVAASFRLSSLRSALFSGPQPSKKKQHDGREIGRRSGSVASVDRTPTSGLLRSLFGRQADTKSPPGGDLWVDVDLQRPATPPLDSTSETSLDWTTEAAGSGPPELAAGEEGQVAMVRRSNSVRPATRRPLPMRVPVVPHQAQPQRPAVSSVSGAGLTTAESIWVRDTTDVSGTRSVDAAQNSARLSGDSGHVSCKLLPSISLPVLSLPFTPKEAGA